ncbi:MAG: TIM barrel protein, partial [Candidatus Diapherotrites archaeon]|nr:TIM barrel protein [Candidatus Diapherotrites archaeon]
GVNLANPKAEKLNRKAIGEAVEAARGLGSQTVVIHPSGDLREGSVEQAYKLLSEFSKEYTDVKLLLENLPLFPSDRRLCAVPSDFLQFIEMGYGVCLDFGHLAATAAHSDLDYEEVTWEFMKLKPNYFHVSNGLARSEADLHMPLNEGDFDLEFFRNVVLTDEPASVVLETPYNPRMNFEEYKAFKEGVFV